MRDGPYALLSGLSYQIEDRTSSTSDTQCRAALTYTAFWLTICQTITSCGRWCGQYLQCRRSGRPQLGINANCGPPSALTFDRISEHLVLIVNDKNREKLGGLCRARVRTDAMPAPQAIPSGSLR